MDATTRLRVRPGHAIQIAVIALIFLAAGVMHFVVPASYIRIVPPWLPRADLLVVVSGVAEILGGVGVMVPATRRAAAWGLIALLVAVFPANMQMLSTNIFFFMGSVLYILLCLKAIHFFQGWMKIFSLSVVLSILYLSHHI